MKKRLIQFEAYYAETIESVWKALTDPDSLSQWLTQGNFKAKRGHRFKWKEPADKNGSQRSTLKSPMENAPCEVQEVDAPYRLSYRVELSSDSASIVTWTLEPAGEGTNVIIEQELLITTELKTHPSIVSMSTYLRNRTMIKMQMELDQKLKKEMELAV